MALIATEYCLAAAVVTAGVAAGLASVRDAASDGLHDVASDVRAITRQARSEAGLSPAPKSQRKTEVQHGLPSVD